MRFKLGFVQNEKYRVGEIVSWKVSSHTTTQGWNEVSAAVWPCALATPVVQVKDPGDRLTGQTESGHEPTAHGSQLLHGLLTGQHKGQDL